MTIRQQLTRQRRRAFYLVALPAWLAFAFGGMTNQKWLIWPAFLCFAGAAVYQIFALRCPVCKGNLGNVYSSGLRVLGMKVKGTGREVRFFPYCATDLDTEIKDLPCPPPS